MIGSYLAVLDALLETGLEPLGEPLKSRQRDYVLARQRADGGFAGRAGASDPYYTDFALRLLALLQAPPRPFEAAAGYLASLAPTPRDAVDAFSRLNCARILRERGAQAAVEAEAVLACLDRQRAPGGGFRRPGGSPAGPSAYHTFLAALCLQMLERPVPDSAGATAAIAALQRPDGGFADTEGEPAGQTNTAAAAIAFLQIHGALTDAQQQSASAYLVAMQAADGGLLAHAAAPEGDLLSTFTGLLTLCGLGAESDLDLRAIARFVGAVAQPSGGFRACPSDPDSDIEYTYYGLATLALLRAAIETRRS